MDHQRSEFHNIALSRRWPHPKINSSDDDDDDNQSGGRIATQLELT